MILLAAALVLTGGTVIGQKSDIQIVIHDGEVVDRAALIK